jgi:hypothetical protein
LLKIIDEDEFIEKCRQGRCLRQTLKSKQCEKDSKKIQCYKKYVARKTKEYEKQFIEVDYEWEAIKEVIKLRDMSCLVLKCLTTQELLQVEKQDGFWLSQKFVGDGAHIVARRMSPSNVYNVNNVALISRFFHSRLDNGLDLVTGEFIGFEGSKRWWERIMRSAGYWKDNYTYDDFYRDITGENK